MANLKIIVDAVGIVIPEFDFLVVRFFWQSESGQDLDTATGIVNSNISALNNKSVGFKTSGSVVNLGDGNAPYLKWGSDNTGDGYESVLIDTQSLYSNYPTLQDEVEILLTCIWYNTRRLGDVNFSLTAYKGGTMNLNNFNYTNAGGQEVFTQSFTKNIISSDIPSLENQNFESATGNKLGKIILKNSNKTASLQLL